VPAGWTVIIFLELFLGWFYTVCMKPNIQRYR